MKILRWDDRSPGRELNVLPLKYKAEYCSCDTIFGGNEISMTHRYCNENYAGFVIHL
jgi:hypothetical protein